MIRFGRSICGDLEQAERREWWLSNGLGGYAAGTIAGSLTRRYHGLLITPTDAALDRQLLFSRAEATLNIGGRHYPLSCNRWHSGAIAPRGNEHIESFYLDGQLPVWTYAVAGVRLQQRIFMQQGKASVWVAFRLLEKPDDTAIHLHLHLLVNQRDHHGQMSSDDMHPKVRLVDKRSLQVVYDNAPTLHIQLSDGELQQEYTWIKDLLLPREHERGLMDRDNHLAVAVASMTLNDTNWHGLHAGLKPCETPDPSTALQHERSLQSVFISHVRQACASTPPEWIEQLMLSAHSFVFSRPLKDGSSGESIIAGYPWFGDWGRDTMIALPGLLLSTGQLSIARSILETWGGYVDQGMIPNHFPESPAANAVPEYNSVDASLWFILAWHAYMRASGDTAALKGVMPVLKQIIHTYQHGARYQIHMDKHSGLLHIGELNTQITWMDARVDGISMTPRTGKPVEINALWYNALMAMQEFSEHLANDDGSYARLAQQTRHGFLRYLRPGGGLYDVLDTPHGDDSCIRPNQLFAVSLPYPLLDAPSAHAVLDEVRRHLHTSYGIRSLSPQDPAYQGHYKGGVALRDAAYHNGPAWGWLLGHYVMAHFRLHRDADAAYALLEPIRDHLLDCGLGSISEIFDGEAPHKPGGTPAQAWSVATILEAWQLIQTNSNQGQQR